MRVVLASKNAHKLVEISKITEQFGIELVLQSELGIDIDVEETGTTFEENSFIKAQAVMQAHNASVQDYNDFARQEMSDQNTRHEAESPGTKGHRPSHSGYP